MATRPQDFAGPAEPPDGGPGWELYGELHTRNPRLLLDDSHRDLLMQWRQYQGGMAGAGHLPDGGGINDQACWLIEAFSIMNSAEHELKTQASEQ